MIKPALYDDLVMDHIKNARNYREISNADYRADGANPLCGDELTVFVRRDDNDCIADIAYQCTCCGISMASASLMTEHVKGRPARDVTALLRAFRDHPGGANPAVDVTDPVVQTVLGIARQYPVRQRCALLPWETLGQLLDEWT